MVDGGPSIRVVCFLGRIFGRIFCRADLLILVAGAAVVILSVVHWCSRPGRGGAAVEMGWWILVVVFCELLKCKLTRHRNAFSFGSPRQCLAGCYAMSAP